MTIEIDPLETQHSDLLVPLIAKKEREGSE